MPIPTPKTTNPIPRLARTQPPRVVTIRDQTRSTAPVRRSPLRNKSRIIAHPVNRPSFPSAITWAVWPAQHAESFYVQFSYDLGGLILDQWAFLKERTSLFKFFSAKNREVAEGCLFISINIDKEPIPWFKVIGPSSRIYHVVSKIAKLFIHDALGPLLISISMRWIDINNCL